jgi:hypothetical protein
MANMMLPINSSSVMPTLPMATPIQSTFFNWNLMVDLTSVILLARSSLWETGVGNFPALERPGPRRRGICLIKASEEMKASYLRASFLMSFLFLLSFFKSYETISIYVAQILVKVNSRQCSWHRHRGAWHDRCRAGHRGRKEPCLHYC